MTNIYYIYAYLRKDGTPYYIGKGKGRRAYEIKSHTVYPPKDKSRICFIATELSEWVAFTFEIYAIHVLGRKSNNTGILRNLSDGGDGPSGMRHTEETKQKIREANNSRVFSEQQKEAIAKKLSVVHKGKTLTIEQRLAHAARMRGRKTGPCSEQRRQRISAAHKGKIMSPEARQAMRDGWAKRKQSLLQDK